MASLILISPSLENRIEYISKALEEAGLKNPHSDLLYFPSDSKLGIAEARLIKDHLLYKPNQAKGKGVVLEDASGLTIEAQNALLKTLEEPPEHAVILLGASSDSNLLPTILSRCQELRLQGTGDSGQEKDFTKDLEKLIESDLQTRFEYIEKLKERAEFLHFMVSYFHHNLPSHIGSGNTVRAEFLNELLEAEKWAKQNVNIRGILEYLMLVMPFKGL